MPMPDDPPSARAHSIWLTPQGAQAADLTQVIQDLSSRHATPSFQPHVTLLGDLMCPPADTQDALYEVLGKSGPIEATVTGLARTDAYFMALFLDLRLNADLAELRERLGERLTGVKPAALRPHLSLAYGLGEMPAASFAQIRTRFHGARIQLSRAVVVASACSIPIESWSEISAFTLDSGAN